MVNEGLIVGMRKARAIADHVGDESCAVRHWHIRIAERLYAGINLVAGFGDAPLHRPVHRALFLGLAGMEGLDRIGIIMAQHAERIGGLAPLLATEMVDRRRKPFHRLARRAAPLPFGNVQDMVAEILELGIRRLGPFEQVLVVNQEQVLPLVGLLRGYERQRVHRDIVVRRAAPMAANYSFEQRHARLPSRLIQSGSNEKCLMIVTPSLTIRAGGEVSAAPTAPQNRWARCSCPWRLFRPWPGRACWGP